MTKKKLVFVSDAKADLYRLFRARSSTSTGCTVAGMTSHANTIEASMMPVVSRQSHRAAERKEGPVVTQKWRNTVGGAEGWVDERWMG